MLAKVSTLVAASLALCNAFDPVDGRPNVDFDYEIDEDKLKSRSVIMMIPDGTGPNIWVLARNMVDPTHKKMLHIDPLFRGSVQTFSNTSLITDSASSATAYATGFKTYDAGIGVDMEKRPLGTILEAAQARGMVVGMIVTSRVTHATPASFAAHIHSRSLENDIADQYCANANLDFLLGGGKRHFSDACLAKLKAAGYTITHDKDELAAYRKTNEANGTLRMFGLYQKSHMSYEVDRIRGETNEPSLSEMTEHIFAILKNNKRAQKHGFFVMIEGSRVDHAGHSNDAGTMGKEAIEFDNTVSVVKQFVYSNPNVAMISAADHGTGGITLGRDGVYKWKPEPLVKQVMSTEGMKALFSNDRATYTEATALQKVKDLIIQNSATKKISKEWDAIFAAEVKKIVANAKYSTSKLVVYMGQCISQTAHIAWTTVGHVGTDVNLYCAGPSVFTRRCNGNHDNTHLNRIMTNYLNLDLQPITLKLRGYKPNGNQTAAPASTPIVSSSTPATTSTPESTPVITSTTPATTSATPVTTSATPLAIPSSSYPTTSPGVSKPSTTVWAKPTLKPGCINVSVVGDATYCVSGPICGDEGSNCPKKGAVASQDCSRHLASFNGDWCVAKTDAVCERIHSGARGCVFKA
ncbi:hypothetical protein H257_06140 [Aphanomyces astaci]|uniref:Alkaline phosphatase n=1 Tax=Aphanomyces astaci TaxID=112090 RepID=W4GMP6_APHAT|nr:hypothetical protein H257_06140 [Aphanomyces astaci]ETV80616.1 hypothetical protein H257_06140 [Aphanomyces astaci]|eukprot:XP_009829563.1 hypothetical protein H257_06140 [Aphanomyces astaci]